MLLLPSGQLTLSLLVCFDLLMVFSLAPVFTLPTHLFGIVSWHTGW